MRFLPVLMNFGLGLTLSIALGIIPGVTAQEQPQQPAIFFLRSPRLLDAMTTFFEVSVWSAIYYFTLELPSDIGQPLGRVTIHQRQGFEQIGFDLSQTLAFIGTPDNRGQPIVVTPSWDETTQTVAIALDLPVPVGSIVTVGIKPWRNPDYSGIYLFGVSAYPPGDSRGLYLGVGHLQFFRGGSWF